MKYIKTYEGLFDFFKKKKPVRELPTEILYEPMNAIESDAFLKSHEMIDFNMVEVDYFWLELKNKLTHNTYNFKLDGFDGLIEAIKKLY